MIITDDCEKCLYSKQKNLTDNPAYLAGVRELLKNRREDDSAPVMVYHFNMLYQELVGELKDYIPIKKKYNDLALSMEKKVRQQIESSSDPTAAALAFSRVGNYIDFGTLNDVSEEGFLALLGAPSLSKEDEPAYKSFLSRCEKSESLLLLADNCGEIVFDKLLLEQIRKRYPQLALSVMVRGGEALNDVTAEDAAYVGIDRVARIISNGKPITGTSYDLLCEEARLAVDQAGVILAKGQGNFETFSISGKHAYYCFLCKCDYFMKRFNVPRMTGLFIEYQKQGKEGLS